MKSYTIKIILVLLSMLQLSCSNNIFSEAASKNSEDALLIDAQTAVNAQQYQTAIDIVTLQLSQQTQAKASTKEILASAYAGKCGLNFINFVNALSTATSGSAFVLVSVPFIGQVVDPPSCLLSLNVIESIGTTAQRTSTENAFASVVGMSLMGAAVRLYTDNSPIDGNGTQDSNNISCTLTNTQIDYVVLGFGFMSKNFSYLGSAQLGSSSQTTLDTIITTCTSIAGNNCTITDPAAITQSTRDTIMDLMNTVEYGVGTYATGGNPLLIPGSCP